MKSHAGRTNISFESSKSRNIHGFRFQCLGGDKGLRVSIYEHYLRVYLWSIPTFVVSPVSNRCHRQYRLSRLRFRVHNRSIILCKQNNTHSLRNYFINRPKSESSLVCIIDTSNIGSKPNPINEPYAIGSDTRPIKYRLTPAISIVRRFWLKDRLHATSYCLLNLVAEHTFSYCLSARTDKWVSWVVYSAIVKNIHR